MKGLIKYNMNQIGITRTLSKFCWLPLKWSGTYYWMCKVKIMQYYDKCGWVTFSVR